MRDLVIAEAREWIGTPFKLQAAIKNVGCDCVGLIIGVGKQVGLARDIHLKADVLPPQHYTLRSNPNILLDQLDSMFTSIDAPEQGALALMLFGKHFHLGFLAQEIDHPTKYSLIHQDISAGEVVEHALTPSLYSKIVTIYRTINE